MIHEVQILRYVAEQGFNKDKIHRRIFDLEPNIMRYFVCHVYQNFNGSEKDTDYLLEVTREHYDDICNDVSKCEIYEPVKYMSREVPTNKCITYILNK